MPVTEQYTPISATGTGLANQVIPVPAIWFGQSTVIVEVAGNSIGWNKVSTGVELTSTVASGAAISVYRETSLTQNKDFQTAGRMPATEVAEGFDRQILINQEVKDRSTFLPPNTTTQNKINTTVGFDANGDPVLRTATQESTHLNIPTLSQVQGFANTAEEQAGFANQERVLAEAAAVAAQSATQNVAGAVTPQDYGAFGDGASHPASGSYSTLALAQAVYPRCAALTEELDGLAIQKACDTGGRVFIADGTYKISTTIELKTQGQIIEGESSTSTILQWVQDVNGFEIEDNPNESNTTNFPTSSSISSSWGQIRTLLIYGPTGSTKKGITNTEDPNSTLWVGEGWRYDFLTILNWHTGIYSSSAARLNGRSINIKSCSSVGLHLSNGSSATNNCHVFYGISMSFCDIGIKLQTVRSAWIQLQDTTGNRVDVSANASLAHIEGGQAESYTERFLIAENSSRMTVSNVNILASTTIIPISVDGNSSVKIVNCQNVQAGNQVEIAEILDTNSTVFGTAHLHLSGSAPGTSPTSRVRISQGDSNTSEGAFNVFSNTTSYAVGDYVKFQSGGTTSYFVCTLAYTGGASSETNPALVVNSSSVSHFSANNTANDDSVFLCPIPWRLGTSLLPSDSNHRGALHWRGAVSSNNLNNDDLQGVIEIGGNYVRADAFKRNTFSINVTSNSYYPQGFEDVILMDNTGTRTINLRAANSPYYRASTNMRVFTIIDSAGTAHTSNIAINASGSDTINGSTNNYFINTQYGSVKIGTTGDGKWFILP